MNSKSKLKSGTEDERQGELMLKPDGCGCRGVSCSAEWEIEENLVRVILNRKIRATEVDKSVASIGGD